MARILAEVLHSGQSWPLDVAAHQWITWFLCVAAPLPPWGNCLLFQLSCFSFCCMHSPFSIKFSFAQRLGSREYAQSWEPGGTGHDQEPWNLSNEGDWVGGGGAPVPPGSQVSANFALTSNLPCSSFPSKRPHFVTDR